MLGAGSSGSGSSGGRRKASASVASRAGLVRRLRRCTACGLLRIALTALLLVVPAILLVLVMRAEEVPLRGGDVGRALRRRATQEEPHELLATAPPVAPAGAAGLATGDDGGRGEGKKPTSAAGLAHTFDGVRIPTRLGKYDLSAACAASVGFLHRAGALATRGAAPRTVHPDQKLYQAIDRARNPDTNLVTIAFVSVKQYRIALNWLYNLRQVKVRNVLILALDGTTASLMQLDSAAGMVVLPLVESGAAVDVPLHELRFHIFTYALCTGVNVVMSDIDAVWTRNPIQDYMLSSPNDCVFAGDDSPAELVERWAISSVASFCVFFCRANGRTLALAAAGQAHLARESLTDSDALNYGLDDLGVDNDGLRADPPLPITSLSDSAATTRALHHARYFHGVTAQPVMLTFTILPRTVITRTCGIAFHGPTWTGSVAHCTATLGARNGDIETLLRMKGLWRLADGPGDA